MHRGTCPILPSNAVAFVAEQVTNHMDIKDKILRNLLKKHYKDIKTIDRDAPAGTTLTG